MSSDELSEITRVLAAINRTLLPPLRIAWSRVGILNNGVTIPYTKKGALFRKKFEELFGEFVETLLRKDTNVSGGTSNGLKSEAVAQKSETGPTSQALNGNSKEGDVDARVSEVQRDDPPRLKEDITAVRANGNLASKWKQRDAKQSITNIVAGVLGLDDDSMRANPNTSFAEVMFLIRYLNIICVLIFAFSSAWNGLKHGRSYCEPDQRIVWASISVERLSQSYRFDHAFGCRFGRIRAEEL